MTPRRVLFIAEATHLAHVGRLLTLARGLDRQRFTPVLAWHPRYNRLLGDLGFEFFPLHSISSELYLKRLRSIRPVYDFDLLSMYAAWDMEIFREARPDVVVGDSRLSLPVSTRIARVPFVNIVNAHWSPHAKARFSVPESALSHALGIPLAQAVYQVLRPQVFRAHVRDFNRMAERFGGESLGTDLRAIYCQGDRTLYPDLPEVTPTPGRPSSHQYLGPLSWSPDLAAPDFLAQRQPGEKVVYVSMGSSGDEWLLPRVLRVLSRLPVRVFAAAGQRIRVEDLGPRVHIAPFLPGAAVCRVADLMICNGSAGGAQQAMLAGLPVIGIASRMDQLLHMQFVEKAGAGRLVRGQTVSDAQLLDTIATVLDDAPMRDQAQALAAKAAHYDAGAILGRALDEVLAPATAGALGPDDRRQMRRPAPDTGLPITSPELAHELALAAHQAPSVGNSQPLRFAWDGDALELFLDPQHANPFLDFVNADSWLTLGMALTNMEATAALRGHGLWTDMFPVDARNGLVARIRLTSAPAANLAPLAAALGARCTNRRAYDDRQLPSDLIDELTHWAAEPGVKLHWVQSRPQRQIVARALAVFYDLLFDSDGMHASLFQWMRFSQEEANAKRDGLDPASLELKGVGKFGFWLLQSRWRSLVLRRIGFLALVRRWSEIRFRQSGAFCLLTGDHDNGLNHLAGGRALERLWLAATRRGLALQPLSGLLLLDFRIRNANGAGLTPRQRVLAQGARAALQKVWPDFADRTPLAIFRIGFAPPPTGRSLRTPLESVFLDNRPGNRTLLPAAATVAATFRRTTHTPQHDRPLRVLFVAEAVTVTHVGRMFRLASQLDPKRFTPILAWHPRYNHLLGPLQHDYYPLDTIGNDDFLQRLAAGQPVYDFETLERYVACDLEIFRACQPDVVVGDYRLSLMTSTRFVGIPFVNVVNGHWSPHAKPRFVVPDTPVTRLLRPRLAQLIFDLGRPFFFRAYAEVFNRLNAKFGWPKFGSDLRKIYCYGDRTLYPDVSEMVPTQGLPATHRFLGPVVWSPDLPPPRLPAVQPGQKTVYVNLGTSGNAELLPVLLRLLVARGHRVIAATAGMRLPELAPSPLVCVQDFVSGDAACRLADLVVFNGGSAGGHQALLAGVPVLGIPSNLDQFLNMHFVEKSGVGRVVRNELANEASLGQAVDDLLGNSAYRERAQRLGQQAAQYDSGQILSEVLDELMAEQSLAAAPCAAAPLAEAPPAVAVPAGFIESVVEAARLAPSSANSQPWRFVWDGRRLSIRVRPERVNPFLNFMNPDAWLSLGAVLANIRVTAAALGYRCEVELLPRDAHEGLTAQVGFTPGSAPHGGLATAVAQRVTNRNAYDARAIPADLRGELLTVLQEYQPTVRLDWVEEPQARQCLADALSIFNRALFENDGFRSSFLSWFRRTPEELARSRDGMGLDALELSGLTRHVFSWFSRPTVARWATPTGFYRLFQRSWARRARSSAAFGLLTVPLNDPVALVKAGEVMELIWLSAAQLGIAFQPLGGALMMMGRVRFAGGAGLNRRHRRMTDEAMAVLGQVFPSFDTRVPALCFRLGYPLHAAHRVQRLALQDIFQNQIPAERRDQPRD